MPVRNYPLLKRRNEKIVARYNKLSKKQTRKGKPIHSFAFIIETLSDEFFLTEATIMIILRKNS